MVYPLIPGSVVEPSVIATVAIPTKCKAVDKPKLVRNVSAVRLPPNDTLLPAIVMLEYCNLALVTLAFLILAVVTALLAIVVATDQPALEEAVPVTSPVNVTDLAALNSVADEALPDKAPTKVVEVILAKPLIVLGTTKVALALPSTAVPVVPAVAEIEIVLLLPQLSVVISALPSKVVLLIFLPVCNLVAVAAFPVHEPDEPLTLPDTLPTKVLAIIVPSSLIVNKSV